MSKRIYLSGKRGKGKFAIVDDKDFNWLAKYTWSWHKGYARGVVDGKLVLMHRLIMNAADPKIQVDHINRKKLDNLRFATNSQQRMNVRSATKKTPLPPTIEHVKKEDLKIR